MMKRISNGWKMAMASFKTINDNKTLLFFPVLSSIALILILASFFGGGYFLIGDKIDGMIENNDVMGYALIFVYYFINYFVIIFFNSALLHCAVKAFNDEPTSIGDGISFASNRIGRILMWTAISATVGTILQVIRDQGKIGQIVGSLIGFAWTVMTFFAVPVIIFQDRGVVDSIKESMRLMKEQWGESIVANVSFSLFYFLGVAVSGGITFLLMKINPILAIATGVGLFLLMATVITAARTIFVAAVYNKVVGQPTGYFDTGALDSAFTEK